MQQRFIKLYERLSCPIYEHACCGHDRAKTGETLQLNTDEITEQKVLPLTVLFPHLIQIGKQNKVAQLGCLVKNVAAERICLP